VLRALFGTTRFEKLEKKLDDKRKDLETGIISAREASIRHRSEAVRIIGTEEVAPADPSLGWFIEQLTGLEILVEERRKAAETAEEERAIAGAEAERLREIGRRQNERAEAQTKLATLESQAGSIAADNAALELDTRGAAVFPQLEFHRDALQAVIDAETAMTVATANADLGTPVPDNAAAAAALEKETDQHLGALETALTDEETLPTVSAQLDSAEKDLETAAANVTIASERTTSLPGIIATTNNELQRLAAVAALEPAARESVSHTEASLDAARLADAKRGSLKAQNDVLLLASTADSEASAKHTDLLHRQLSGYASVLATALTDGDPCPVCGATAHPAPAHADESTITQDDVDVAKNEMDKKRAALDAAGMRKAEIQAELAAADATAGGKMVDDLALELESAKGRLDIAVDASTATDAQRRAIADFEAELTRSAAESTRLTGLLEIARSARVSFATQLKDLKDRLVESRGEYESVAERVASLRNKSAALRAFRSAADALAQARTSESKVSALVAGLLAEHGFETADLVESTHLAHDTRLLLNERVRQHQTETDSLGGVIANLADVSLEPVLLETSSAALAAAAELRDQTRDAHVAAVDSQIAFKKLLGEVKEDAKKNAELLAEYDQVRQLAAAVAGKTPNTKSMRLETYVLAAELEDIVEAANQRLAVMTSGRYVLQHDDKAEFRNVRGGLGLEILDQYSGRVRATHSLSGGETFLASLALALGLAEVVSSRSGAVKLDTLFIDEGFGSLDADTLELAMSTLDALRAGGRTIGIISHVEAMKEQVHTQLRVEVSERGDSVVRA
jgi:exonuclease SbcC